MKILLKQSDKQNLTTALAQLRSQLSKFQLNEREKEKLYAERDAITAEIAETEKKMKPRDTEAAKELAAKRELLRAIHRDIAAVERAEEVAFRGKGPKADEDLREVLVATIAISDKILMCAINAMIDDVAKTIAPFYETAQAARYAAGQCDKVLRFGQHVIYHKFLPRDSSC